jgi:protoheme IX farnesyltransferase
MNLLPSAGGKTKKSAWITFNYTLVLIPLSVYPYFLFHKFSFGILLLTIASVLFAWLAFRLYQSLDDRDAKKLMFGSFAHILVFLISLFFIV